MAAVDPKKSGLPNVPPHEEKVFPPEEIQQCVAAFLEKLGYQVKLNQRFLFSEVSLQATREKYTLVGQVKSTLDQAIEGFKDLCTAKCRLGDEVDYVLILGPTNEHKEIEFLAEKSTWLMDIRSQYFMMWHVNPERGTIDNLVGAPRDPLLNGSFNLNLSSTFCFFLNKKIDDRMRRGEI